MFGMVNLNFDDLRLFARVAALGTLSAAARERNVPVSQISRTLQRIETAYGAQLMHRSTHGLSLTPEGAILQTYALRILGEVDALDAEFGQTRDRVTGLVRVSMSTVIAQHLMVDSLPALHAKYPELRLDFRVDDALVDMAREGIDIAIRTGEPQTDTLVMRKLGILHRCLYASPTYLQKRGTPHSVDDLRQHDMVTHSQHDYLNVWPTQSGIPFRANGPFSSNNAATMTSMAIAGLGIARIPSLVAEPLVVQNKLVGVLIDQIDDTPTTVSAFMLSGRHRLPKIRACIDHWVEWLQATPHKC
jgi:DNA-binding transcriptional LysR family regulator